MSPQSSRREGGRDARIGHELSDDGPPLLRIAPFEVEAALDAGGVRPVQPLGLHDLVSIPALEAAGLVDDVTNPIRDEVVGVADCTASENGVVSMAAEKVLRSNKPAARHASIPRSKIWAAASWNTS